MPLPECGWCYDRETRVQRQQVFVARNQIVSLRGFPCGQYRLVAGVARFAVFPRDRLDAVGQEEEAGRQVHAKRQMSRNQRAVASETY